MCYNGAAKREMTKKSFSQIKKGEKIMENRKIYAIFGEEPDELEFGYDEDYLDCTRMKLYLVLAMQLAMADGCECFMSTVEQGAAMWGAEACMALRALGKNVGLVTVPTGELQAAKWHPERRERYFDVLTKADSVIDLYDVGENVSAEDYILANVTNILILGDIRLPRLARLAERAKRLGIKVTPIDCKVPFNWSI